MKNVSIILAALAVSVAPACGSAGGSTPEAVMESLLNSYRTGDKAEFAAAFPTREHLDNVLECDDVNAFWTRIERKLQRFDLRIEKAAGTKFEFVSMEPTKYREKIVRQGETLEGCKARTDIVLRSVQISLNVTKAGKTAKHGTDAQFIKASGGWFILEM